ncbi:MAG: MarR family transcriptional regulator [Anaerotignum sp.]|nr:MarR family transcriptional regulator [Anaerotignum sp.]MBR6542570.1 MarR family transcriptional regulator [Anaerotignum sp.]
MKPITGREIVYDMMQLGMQIDRWNKQYATKKIVAKRLDELGLTHHQVQILGFLKGNPEVNTVSDIAAELIISKGSLSLMLTKLQQAGFVAKKSAEGEDDGRKVYVTLTEKGMTALEEIMDLLLDSASIMFEKIDEERRTQIYKKVQELTELFDTGGWKE